MSLQIWLPLNKEEDVTNKGLSDISVTNTGGVFNINGKLGGCYELSNATKRISFPSKSWMQPTNDNDLSIALWVNPTTFNYIIAANAFELSMISSKIMFRLGDGNTNTISCNYTDTFSTETWYHIAVTWNATSKELRIYLNGSKVATATSTLTSFNTINSTINLVYGGSWKINDFRMYDHCLSPKEVLEIAKGLVVHYPMDDESVTTTMYDCSGLGNNGTITGTISTSTDTPKYSRCMFFNGKSSVIKSTLNNNSDYTYTFSTWIKPTTIDGDTRWIFAIADGSTNDHYFGCYINSSTINLNIGGTVLSNTQSHSYSFTTNTWYHLCVSSNAGAFKIFINGVQLGNTYTGIKTSTGNNFWIGQRPGSPGNYNFCGNMSDFRIYATALSESDIQDLYKTSACILNNGVLETEEFVEEDSLQISKNGIVSSSNFIENEEFTNCAVYTDKITASSFDEI